MVTKIKHVTMSDKLTFNLSYKLIIILNIVFDV